MLMSVQFNLIGDIEEVRTIEDDMHPGNDQSQCQHIKIGLAIMF